MKRLKKWFKNIYKILRLEEMQILPGQLAFFLVVSVFAMLPLIALIGSSFVTREFAHNYGIFHKSVSLFIINENEEILLQ